MYHETETRPYTIDSEEIRALIDKRVASVNGVLAKIETTEARDRDEAEYLKDAAAGWRSECEELVFLRDHVAPGAHRLTSQEMASLRASTSPAQLPDIEQARRLRGFSVSNTQSADVGAVRGGRVRLF